MRITGDFLRGRGRTAMTREEKDVLEAAVDRVETFPARTVVIRRGETVDMSTLLIDGVMCRYMDARDGYRQLVAIQLAGDFVDLHGYPLRRLDHDVATISDVRVALVPHDRLTRILETHPHLTRILWRSTLLDAALHREWIFRLGRLDAAGRVAHVLMELHARLAAVGRARDGRFALPLTQQDLGEICGLTAVHVNRTLRRLREDGLAEVARGEARIVDAARLARVAEFDPDYLYLDGGPWQEL
ncbi:Crp/Fnr family transcriptional regulator [Sphingomonas sp. Leaf412]|uniref:Crp/Fnr family transcriptional regulator n=1 Tax=Sphingomonas sp. Leaf412 TaxID=1736370 RepID=UPI0006FB7190|nr:Crp/Fnr family transcriptional regulator [Sphingomonas sp. Leaf412]KQT33579.1 Crp/Fnr family transcriptional regulator [Sphingomonas sp. Leaf412]